MFKNMIKEDNHLKSRKNYIKRIIMLTLGILIATLGMTLLIKSSLGQSTVSAISYNIGVVTNMKTGTILAVINYICFFVQIILLRRNFKVIQILQLVITTIFGGLVNIFLYDISFISNMDLNNYILKLVVLICGIIFMAYGISLMMIADLIFMPFEGLCNLIASKLKIPFGTLRRYVDILFVIISIAIIIIYKIPNTSIREGTILYTILFGTLTNVFISSMKENRSIFKKITNI